MKKSIFGFLTACSLFHLFIIHTSFASFDTIIKDKTRIMIVITDGGKAADFVGYAENLLKKKLKQLGAAIINPAIMKKVKEDKLLWLAIQNGNASAMAKISTDYGAVVLVRGTLSVDSRQKFAASWEGTASLSLVAIDTRTAEEIVNVNSDPLGSTLHPSPIEDSPLIAKQMAVKKVCDNVLVKTGVLSDATDVTGVKTITFELYDIFKSDSLMTSAIVFSEDGEKLFLAAGSSVAVWGLHEKRLLYKFSTIGSAATALSMSPNNSFLAAGDVKGVIYVWKISDGSQLLRSKTRAGQVTSIAFSPDSATIAIAGSKKKIVLLSLTSGKIFAALKGHRKPISSLAFTPNGKRLISASSDLSVRWWDMNTQKEIKAMSESTDKLLCMALSADGSIVALSTVDVHIDLRRRIRRDFRHIKIRNTATGEEIRTLDGHKKDITALSFHPSKRYLASGSIDDTIRIWDIQKGEMATFFQQNDDIIDLDFSNDGIWFAALSKNRTLSVWKLR